ncbi:MAG: MarR family transcriptional regulator [Bifidobacteriaceae bacterium]|jgi:DNA-binding MarR family transcriptional regulator|nr:MarR family transcriptional regulator [Bifidobacteriaceae bacterium]
MHRSCERERLVAELKGIMDSWEAAMIRHRVSSRSALDITPQQIRALGLLLLGGPTRSSDLADSLEVSRATMSGLLDRLEHAGFVTRATDPSDARGRLAEITDLGRDALRHALTSFRYTFDEVLAELTVPGLRALTRGLGAVLEIMRVRQDNAAGGLDVIRDGSDTHRGNRGDAARGSGWVSL